MRAMWSVVSLVAAIAAIYAIWEFWSKPEQSAERAGRIAAAFRRGYRGDAPPPDGPDRF